MITWRSSGPSPASYIMCLSSWGSKWYSVWSVWQSSYVPSKLPVPSLSNPLWSLCFLPATALFWLGSLSSLAAELCWHASHLCLGRLVLSDPKHTLFNTLLWRQQLFSLYDRCWWLWKDTSENLWRISEIFQLSALLPLLFLFGVQGCHIPFRPLAKSVFMTLADKSNQAVDASCLSTALTFLAGTKSYQCLCKTDSLWNAVKEHWSQENHQRLFSFLQLMYEDIELKYPGGKTGVCPHCT